MNRASDSLYSQGVSTAGYSPAIALLRLFALASLCLLLLACSSPPQLPRLSSDAVILAFGDSLTHGTGAAKEQSYPAVLERLSGYRVVNRGVPGEVTAQGLKRLPAVLDEVQPELMILCHGGNDMLRKTGMAAAAANLRAMIRMAQARNISVVLLAVPRPGVFLTPPEFYEDVADETGVPIESDVIADVLSERSLKSDTIHPNAEGYRMMAESLFSLLQETGAL